MEQQGFDNIEIRMRIIVAEAILEERKRLLKESMRFAWVFTVMWCVLMMIFWALGLR